ncbi:hypothetical protein PaG_00185 [Moesziomyces aphidis]|uniref:Uncharacterized protein n=1 Tax=Moesziomyces aphidis TaxID=84754 RepID=W3VWB7_MOEAP|nr:hypothetical protein PaG_00185 [Moesziomyces aphidis]
MEFTQPAEASTIFTYWESNNIVRTQNVYHFKIESDHHGKAGRQQGGDWFQLPPLYCSGVSGSSTYVQSRIMSQQSGRQKEYSDEGGVIIFNIGIPACQQSSVDDGRKVIDQFIDLLRGYADDPNVTIESAHYEPATATIFINDPTERIEPIERQ